MQFKKWLKRSLFIIPIAVGVTAVVVAPKMKTPPQKVKVIEKATKVRIIKPLNLEVSPKALGYGVTSPARSWDAIAEVAGRIVWMADNLKEGNIIPEGTKLAKIDDSEYKLSLSQIKAQINISRVKTDTIKSSLSLEQKNRDSLKKEVSRQKSLSAKGLSPASTLESAQRSVIKADSTMQSLKNSLSINEAERQVLTVQKQQVELNLSRTDIVSPFDMRIINIEVHEARFANKGQVLFSADATDKTEIEARFPIGHLRPLIANKAASIFPGVQGLDAIVRLRTSSHTVTWEAKVERAAGQIDRLTQTTGVIVSVNDPYGKAQPGHRPPLARNTFVEVELRGRPNGKKIIIPSTALHEGEIYVLDMEDRLDIRKVKVAFYQGTYAVLKEGLGADEKLIISDLIPAIQNMLLEPKVDKKTRRDLVMEVSGKASVSNSASKKSDHKENIE